VKQPDIDAQSMFQVEVPPWAESYEISATDVDGEYMLLANRRRTVANTAYR